MGVSVRLIYAGVRGNRSCGIRKKHDIKSADRASGYEKKLTEIVAIVIDTERTWGYTLYTIKKERIFIFSFLLFLFRILPQSSYPQAIPESLTKAAPSL